MEVMPTKLPTVWMNVTTSANWNRPPVGIVRVEQALCQELQKLIGNTRFKRCVWLGGEFVEWTQSDITPSPQIRSAVETIFPKTESFDLARSFLAKALKVFETPKIKGQAKTKSLDISIPINQASPLRPASGDILISVGLDWDQAYTKFFYTLKKERGISVITCCYDLIPVLFPHYCVGEVAQKFKEYFTQLSWGSNAVLCISKQTQSDYLALCNELGVPELRTLVIPLGDNVPNGEGNVSEQVAHITEEPFILFVSTIERRKNHEVLYRAYHLLARSGRGKSLPKLVFVGMPGWGVGDLLKDIELDPTTQGLIIQLNHVNDADLNMLYKKAMFCVYPSLYEGWGLPVGEALALSKAVVASAQGSLPEVGGDLVRYVDPWNPQAWANVISELVESPQLIVAMVEKVKHGYVKRTWVQTANAVKQLIDEIATNPVITLELTPGYDMSTQVGVHVGAGIMSTGANGFLMFGPHRHLAIGCYLISIWGELHKESNGSMQFELASDDGKVIHYVKHVSINSEIDRGIPFVKFEVNVNSYLDDFEIRCLVEKNIFIQLNKIEIKFLKPI